MEISQAEQQSLANLLLELSNIDIRQKGDLEAWYEEAHKLQLWLKQHDIGAHVPHNLWHWLSDADIRFKDSEYAEMQNKEFKEIISVLQEGRLE